MTNEVHQRRADQPAAVENSGIANPHGNREPEAEKQSSPIRNVVVLLIAALIIVTLVASGILSRLHARKALAAETNQMAAPTVRVITPQRGAPQEEILLPGNIQAFVDSPIYARTNGYLKHWYFDIGAHVRQGQLLADIESPEIDQQLIQAQADLETAKANAHLSQITATRFTNLLKSDAVSTQDTDNAVSDLAAKNTVVNSAQANVNRLKQLVDFEKVYAPFDGVITARNTDIGQLIDSGASGGQARALFQLAATNKLRVFINVPQMYSQAATPGMKAYLTFAEFPGRSFPGTLVRTSKSIDPTSRTLNVEVDIDNSKGELLPGAYAEVHLKVANDIPTLIVPVSALLFREEGLRIAIAKSDNTAALIPITLGRDFGDVAEVTTGLTGDERVIPNPPDSIINGEKLNVRVDNSPTSSADEDGKK